MCMHVCVCVNVHVHVCIKDRSKMKKKKKQEKNNNNGAVPDLFTFNEVAQLSLRVFVVQCDFLNLAGQVRLLCPARLQLPRHTTNVILFT